MKKLLIIFVFCVELLPTSAKEALRVNNSVPVKQGIIKETGVLADDKGVIFAELLQKTNVKTALNQEPFNGEILPLELALVPDKAPRPRMREVVTFNLYTDNNEDIYFVDKYSLIRPKEIIRLEKKYPEGLERSGGVKIIIPLNIEDEIRKPVLYHYDIETFKWNKIGGKIELSSEEDTFIFISRITRSGIYTVWDENPLPIFAPTFPIDQIQFVEKSPFPSVEKPEEEGPLEENEDLENDEALYPVENNAAENSEKIEKFAEEINQEINQTTQEEPNNQTIIQDPFTQDQSVIPAVQEPTQTIPANTPNFDNNDTNQEQLIEQDPFNSDYYQPNNPDDFRQQETPPNQNQNWNLQEQNQEGLNNFNQNLKNIFGKNPEDLQNFDNPNINAQNYLAANAFNNPNNQPTLPVAGSQITDQKSAAKFPYALILAILILIAGVYYGQKNPN